ncbi:MAG: hypothetical protein RI973_126 [Bacteroidota bacterium]
MDGKSSLTEIETDAMGNLEGKSLLHLQCHFGLDTLSLARKGAKVTGIDFSGKSITLAREIAVKAGIAASFFETNVYDVPSCVEEQFDIVFTSFGAIAWLPDLDRWASVVDRMLLPGGTFYIAEFHPTLYLFDFDNYNVSYGYFNQQLPYEEIVKGTYAAPESDLRAREYFWNHSLSEVISPFIGMGYRIAEFKEFDFSPYNCFPNMEQASPGRYRWKGTQVSIPHVFSLKAIKGA